MKRKITIILLLFVMIFNSLGVYGESNLTMALKENLIPLKTTKAENGLDDLIPLKDILKDKKIVAMGEATHGTAEFFQMKHRIFEFLVEEMGYRVFGIEAEFGGSQVVNEYILHGEGSVEDCLRAMRFWTWDTKEVAEMIDWMREFNKKAKADDKIRFYGFDMQGIEASLKYILDYLEKIDPNLIKEQKSSQLERMNLSKPDKGNVKILNQHIDSLNSEIIENRDSYIEKSSLEEYELIQQHIEIVYQWIDYTKNYVEFNKRDYYMAENVKWILDHEDKYYGNDKIMLWAHNGHVSYGYGQYINMGQNLKTIFDEGYYSLGFDFYKGSFVARPFSYYLGGLANFHLEASPEDSFAHEMMKTEIHLSFLDLKSASTNNVISDFLSKEMHINSIGAIYSSEKININPENIRVPKDTFDGIIYIQSTSEALRSTGRTLQNGNIVLVGYSILSLLIIISALLLLARFLKKRRLNSEENNIRKFYLLKKEKEGKVGFNVIDGFIVRINDEINTLSKFKYSIFTILILTIVNILLVSSDYYSKYEIQMIYDMQGIFTIFNFTLSSITEIIKVLLIYVYGLSVVKSLLKTDDTYISHILITAIIGALISTFSFRHSGILLYSYKIILNILQGFVLCYSYSLFYHRWNKPLINLSLIIIIKNIVMLLLSVLVLGFGF